MSANTFVPKDYEVTSGGNDFLKLQPGDNKIRILTDALVGVEGWKNNKPFRRAGADASISPDEVDVDATTDKPKINNFMAFYVYSYNDDKVMLAEFTQVGIKKAIVEFASDEDWGHPSGYDITITKTGSGMQTRYSVKPHPAKPLAKPAQTAVDAVSEAFNLKTALNIES